MISKTWNVVAQWGSLCDSTYAIIERHCKGVIAHAITGLTPGNDLSHFTVFKPL